MTADRIITALPALCMAAALLTVAAIIGLHCLREHRTEARAKERRARPHSVNAGTAAQDAAAILREVLATFTRETHPGRRCLQSEVWAETVAQWRAVLDQPAAEEQQDPGGI